MRGESERVPERWLVTWDPEESHPPRNTDPGRKMFGPNEGDAARAYAESLRTAGRLTARLWHMPEHWTPGFTEVAL